MRLRLALAMLAATSTSPVLAAEIHSQSHIDAVTVFPQGAEISRLAEAKLDAGEHTLILEDLPGELDPQSIRVEGDATGQIEIGSVDSKLVYLSLEASDAERKRLEKEIEALNDERASLDQTIADAESRKTLLLSLADKQLAPASPDEKVKAIDATALGGLVDLVSIKLAEISKTSRDARIHQRDIDKQVYDLQAKLAGIAPNQVARTMVSVHLAAPAGANGTFKIKYRIANAGWMPFYDARLTSPEKNTKAKVELIRRAEVMQSTGESWADVALTLSTARPVGATAAPELYAAEIGKQPREGEKKSDELARDATNQAPVLKSEELDAAAPADKPKSVLQTQAQIEIAGFQALYAIPGRVSVDNSGTSKKVRITSGTYEGSLNAVAVPRLDPNAYLTAAFKVDGEAPMLPGTVNLFRDGVFMGQGALPLLNPGEEAKLGFGADDLIKVKRAEVKRTTGEEGLITTSNIDERQWDIVVKNLHKVAIPVTLIDRLPYATNTDITVEPMPGMTVPSEKDLDKKRGVLAWRFDLDPAAEKTVKFGYKVTWPKDMEVGLGAE
jgi:uncharacterized protein (TIGR02231 family)